MDEPVSFLDGVLPEWAAKRVITIGVGDHVLQSDEDWRGELVVVERGELDLELVSGRHCHFDEGAVLWLDGLRICVMHNPGRVPTVLVAVSRRGPVPG